jgi:hypothetical protein
MAISPPPSTPVSADRIRGRAEHSGLPECSAALPELGGEALLDAIVWDQAALDKFRRYFLPKDTEGPPAYCLDEKVVLDEIRRLALREPLTFTERAPSWVSHDAKAIGYATLGRWCAFAIARRDSGRVDREHQASGSYKPYAAIGTFAPIGRGNDWGQIDVNSLSGRVLAYAVLLTKDAARGYARAVGMRETASLSRVRGHFFRAVATRGRMMRQTPPGTASTERAAGGKPTPAGFLVLNNRGVYPICRRDSHASELKRPHPFYAGTRVARTSATARPRP